MNKFIIAFIGSILIVSCSENSDRPLIISRKNEFNKIVYTRKPLSVIEKTCIHAGLVDIRTLDTNIAVS